MEDETIFSTLGYIGSFLIGVMLIPQVYRTIKTKETEDISPYFIILNMIAVGCMIPYSIYFYLYPVFIANCSVCICNIIILIQIIINNNNK